MKSFKQFHFAKSLVLVFLISIFGLACAEKSVPTQSNTTQSNITLSASDSTATNTEDDRAEAIFAGGCFWCMEKPFDQLDGVFSTTSGYLNGTTKNPTYKEVSAGITGHTEAVKIVYDPAIVTYQELLDVFWVNIDPTVENRQFCDRGSQYRSGIYYVNDEQKALAKASLQPVERRFNTVYTEIEPADTFYPAEEYHQDYYLKNPIRYAYYRTSCGRDARLNDLWSE